VQQLSVVEMAPQTGEDEASFGPHDDKLNISWEDREYYSLKRMLITPFVLAQLFMRRGNETLAFNQFSREYVDVVPNGQV
jgi:hypothetical protein